LSVAGRKWDNWQSTVDSTFLSAWATMGTSDQLPVIEKYDLRIRLESRGIGGFQRQTFEWRGSFL